MKRSGRGSYFERKIGWAEAQIWAGGGEFVPLGLRTIFLGRSEPPIHRPIIRKSHIFFCFARDSLPANKPVFILCEKVLTLISRRPQGCVARFGGRARMGTEKARRSLAAAARTGQPGRIIPTPSKDH